MIIFVDDTVPSDMFSTNTPASSSVLHEIVFFPSFALALIAFSTLSPSVRALYHYSSYPTIFRVISPQRTHYFWSAKRGAAT